MACGWDVTPVGWRLALLVRAYALAVFIATDLLKVRFYSLLDHSGARFRRLPAEPFRP